jgi:hypothetical protein
VARPVAVTAPALRPCSNVLTVAVTQGLTLRPPKGGTMRITSRTLGPDDVGSVEATVDGHGEVEGLGAMSWPTPRRAPTGLDGLVVCRNGVPSLTHNGGARPPRQWSASTLRGPV